MRPVPVLLASVLAALALALAGCASQPGGAAPSVPPYPAARFAVISDPHVYDASMSEPGPAWDKYLGASAALYVESAQILGAALEGAAAEKPAFIIVCGDLTKDGELASHRLAAKLFTAASTQGIPVFVVPGNHDILNPGSFRYIGGRTEKVDSVTPEQFVEIYGAFGYDGALMRDPSSLSYVAEPVRGLWLLAIDSCRYRENRERQVSGGRLGSATRGWIASVLAQARSHEIRVIAFLHHPVMEHFRGEKSWIPTDVIDDYDAIGGMLAAGGVQVVFSGHGHSQNITRRSFLRWGARDALYDVETGAACSWPNPWRIVDIDTSAMKIESRFVTSIPDHPLDFPRYSRERLRSGAILILEKRLARALVYGRSAKLLAAQAADVAMAYMKGDEKMARQGFDLAGLDPWAMLVAEAASQPMRDMQANLPPADNNVTLVLGTEAGVR